MSFDSVYADRFKTIIEPAITAIDFAGHKLKPHRVDLSKSGDSILTDIIDGIAHSALILADVSIIGRDSVTGRAYRNGNVMYEVGLALASRHSSEVLLVRDDREPFLFDVSTVPHMHINFADPETAVTSLREELVARLAEIDHIKDARLALAVATLSSYERQSLVRMSKYGMEHTFWAVEENLATIAAIPRLLDKQLIRTHGVTSKGISTFKWTPLGRTLATHLAELMPTLPDDDEAADQRRTDEH